MPFYTGKTGSVTVGGSAQPLTDWSLDGKVEAIEVTNFTSNGYQESEAGIAGCDITASGPYDGGAGAQPGTTANFVLTAGSGAGAPSFTVSARITSIKIDTNVKGVAMISYTAQSTGSFSVTL